MPVLPITPTPGFLPDHGGLRAVMASRTGFVVIARNSILEERSHTVITSGLIASAVERFRNHFPARPAMLLDAMHRRWQWSASESELTTRKRPRTK